MREFVHTIKDPIGIHARPAGLLVKMCKEYTCTVTIKKGEKSAAGTRLVALMGLGVKEGDTIQITVDGADEEKAIGELENFFMENL